MRVIVRKDAFNNDQTLDPNCGLMPPYIHAPQVVASRS